MKETDKLLWNQLFQDKPIPRTALEHFQTELMAQIVAHPVDFREDKRIAERRKWGIGLAISLMVAALTFGFLLWVERNIVFQGLNVLLVMMSGLIYVYVSELQQIGTQLVGYLLFLKELEPGLGLLWGGVSWPILGVLSVLVIFRSVNQVRDERDPLSKKLKFD
jgi:hypothetical protein